MKWLKLQNEGKFGSAEQLVLNNVLGDLRRQRQWKSHKWLIRLCYYWYGRLNRIEVVFYGMVGWSLTGPRLPETGQKERGG